MRRRASSVTAAQERILRCAIYTRKSTEHGLELEFNSLDAQREACEAYIKSQASEGWTCLPKRYDDPAFSGGNLERPALQRLLKDIEAGLVDVIVVYKIDRLTRSLADFAKLVEVFDARSISFVAITQQFNTTTSMGRLTLNILLSFAQFERELSSERVRDKVAASRRKGKWTGGSVPLGYDSRDKKLVVNQTEARTIRMIFERYLALKSVPKLIEELDRKGVVTKKRPLKGKTAGGVPFNYGSLIYLLKNRTYLDEVGHGGKWFEGEHESILDRGAFERVQETLKTNAVQRRKQRAETGALLARLLYDDRGNRMSPSYSIKNGVRYPFYVSAAILKGRKKDAGSVARVPATEIEKAVVTALRKYSDEAGADIDLTPQDFFERLVQRIVVRHTKIVIDFKDAASVQGATKSLSPLEIPWSRPRKNGFAEVSEPEDAHDSGTVHDQPKPEFVQAVARAHLWLKRLQDGTYHSIEDLGRAANIHPKNVRIGLRLAFLAPKITKAILTGSSLSGKMSSGLVQTADALSWRDHASA
ncbi:MAG: recombinase family protein [Pseudorhodoplanes sp.]|jgi:DNA invertase Pin-like site-specific DNA recombinase|nr:recombinase family protein [Pseudorhodoplanes sp.]